MVGSSTFLFFLLHLVVHVSVSVSVSAQPQPVPQPIPDVEEMLQTWNMPVFHIVGAFNAVAFIFRINGTDYRRPSLILNRNQTYQFSIDFINDRVGITPEQAFGFWWNLPTNASPAGAHDVGAIGNSGCKRNTKPNTFITTNITNPCIVTFIPTQRRLVVYAILGKQAPFIGKLRIREPSQPYLNLPTSFPLEGPTFLIPGIVDSQLQMYVDGRIEYYPTLRLTVGVRYSFIIGYENEVSGFGFGIDLGSVDPLFTSFRFIDIGAIGNEFCDTTPRLPYTFQTIYQFQPCIVSLTFNNISMDEQVPFYRSSSNWGRIIIVDPSTSGVLSTDVTTDLIVPAQPTETESSSQLTGISIGVALFVFTILVCGIIIIRRRRTRAILRRVEKESTSSAATDDAEEHQVKLGAAA